MEKNNGRLHLPVMPGSLEGWHEESNNITTRNMQKYVNNSLRIRASLEREKIQAKRK